MTTRHPTLARSKLAIAGVLAASAALTACSTANTTPGPTTAAPAAQPSALAATTPPSAAPTQGTASAATARSLRAAEPVECYAGAHDANCVKPGTYLLDPSIPPGTVTLDVPAGWFEWDPGGGTEGLLVDGGRDAPGGSGWGLLLSAVGTIPRDPCGESRGSVTADQSATVDEIASTMATWTGFRAVTPPQAVRIDGVEGRKVDLSYAGDPAKCAAARLWTTPSGVAVDAYPMISGSASRPAQLYLFDVGDRLMIIRATDYPEPSPYELSQGVKDDPTRHAADQLELRSILSSIRFAPGA